MKPLKTFLRNTFAGLLAWMACGVVRKYKPQIVMVTGSVGKTSTKDALAAALGEKFYMRKSQKSFNSEFGVPFTILNIEKSPWKNPFTWLHVFGEALALLWLPNHYPKLLVLEVGADQPGDLAKVLKIATPDLVVVTLLPEVPVHVEAYATPAELREEEFAPARALPQGAPLIINADDPYALELATRTMASVYTFGTDDAADVQIRDVEPCFDKGKLIGMKAKFGIGEKEYICEVIGSFGSAQLFGPAAAVAAGLALDLTPTESLAGLKSYVPPSGRGRIFAGIKSTILIDDSYNASPVAMETALRSLSLLPEAGRKVAVLGDMLELGRHSLEEHERVGTLAASCVASIITVGQRAKAIGTAAIRAGMSEGDVYHFATSADAATVIGDLLTEGDTILIKGSQSGVRLERVARALLADPSDASQLVRQERAWQKR